MWLLRTVLPIAFSMVILPMANTISAHDDGQLHKLIGELSTQLLSSPDNASLYLERGELFYQHKDWNWALHDFDRAGELNPNLAIVDLYRGRTLLELGSLGPAKVLLDRYLNHTPGDVLALVARARLLMRSREPRAAARDLDRAIEQAPKQEYFYERNQALLAAGEIDEALRGLDVARTEVGLLPHLEEMGVDLEIRQARYDAALNRLDRLIQSAPRREYWLLRKGEILEQAGRFDEARTVIIDTLTAIKRLPDQVRRETAISRVEDKLHVVLDRVESMVPRR